jgi:hypothetical protein
VFVDTPPATAENDAEDTATANRFGTSTATHQILLASYTRCGASSFIKVKYGATNSHSSSVVSRGYFLVVFIHQDKTHSHPDRYTFSSVKT